MLKDITLGQYFPGNSVIHKMDPRAKLIVAILYIVAIFCAQNVICFAALLASAFLLIALSRISVITILRGLKPILFVLVFTALINVFLTASTEEAPLWQAEIPIFSLVWRPTIYRVGVIRAIFTSVRVMVLIMVTSIFLTYTTSPITLTDAIEELLAPLKWLHIPVHDFAMMMTIALRFIPTLIEETDKIMNAQRARGADFANGSLVKRAKALVPVLIPLFVSAFKRAEDLAVAMECRCYRGGKGRTKLHKLQYHWRDGIAMLLMCAFLAGVFVVNYYNPLGIGM
jgi:energy-coupling factor transport system permease protein